jgi:signal recognition particle receptor subunit beta
MNYDPKRSGEQRRAAELIMNYADARNRLINAVIASNRFDSQKHKCNDALCLIIRHL